MLALGAAGAAGIAPAFVPRSSLMGMPKGLLVSRLSSLKHYGFGTPGLRLYAGEYPLGMQPNESLLAEFDLPSFEPASGGVIRAASPIFSSAVRAGVARCFELTNPAGDVVMRGSVGPGGDINMANNWLMVGSTINIVNFGIGTSPDYDPGLRLSEAVRMERAKAMISVLERNARLDLFPA